MAPLQIPPPCTAAPVANGALALLVDEMLDWYVEWGDATVAVVDAYRLWSGAPEAQKAAAFAAYTVALDEEEYAANAYFDAYTKVTTGQ